MLVKKGQILYNKMLKKMLIKCIKRALCFFIALSFVVQDPHFNHLMIVYAIPSSVTVISTKVNIRSGPGTSYNILGTVTLGYKINPIESVSDSSKNGKTWYKFLYENKTGYIRSDFVNEMKAYTYDANFESELTKSGFPETYKPGLRELHANYPNWTFTLQRLGISFDYAVENELIGTRTLVTVGAISSYKSTDTGKYDWTTSKYATFDGNAWVCASKEVTECYMDPRNFLYSPYIFQFELQTFNSNIHTKEGIKEMVKGTFLDANVETEGLTANVNVNTQNVGGVYPNISNNIIPNTNSSSTLPGVQVAPFDTNGAVVPILGFTSTGPMQQVIGPGLGIVPNSSSNSANIITAGSSDNSSTDNSSESFNFTYLPKGTYSYADLIYDAARQVGANPYVIVSMILQEQGKDGTDSVSGKNSKYKGYYNYGNINAFASSGLSSIENGLKYAADTGSYNRPWNTKEKGIYGLCDFYANSYVKKGQDTFYLKKWNVQGENMFKHQYMTNVAGAASEGQILGSSYDEVLLSMPHEFKIPLYENMPATNCPMPTKDGSPNNKLKTLSVQNYVITPTFNADTNDYTLMVGSNVNSVFIEATAYDGKAAVGGVGLVYTTTSYTYAIIYCVAENGDIRQYNINIYKNGAENVVANTITNNNLTIPQITLPNNGLSNATNINNSTNINFNNITSPNTIANDNMLSELERLGPVQVGVGPK